MVSRLAVIADIHGNFQALQSVLYGIEAQNVKEIISLGDNIGYGPEPCEVVKTLMERDIRSVMGNHELALINPVYFKQLNPICRESLDINRSLLSSKLLAWLANLDRVILHGESRFVHGCPPGSITTYLFNPSLAKLDRIFMSYPECICFVGHTHTLDMFTKNTEGTIRQKSLRPGFIKPDDADRCLVIPGSVGQPRDTIDNKAKYIIWDPSNRSFEVRAVPYDVNSTVELLKERGFPISNAIRLQ